MFSVKAKKSLSLQRGAALFPHLSFLSAASFVCLIASKKMAKTTTASSALANQLSLTLSARPPKTHPAITPRSRSNATTRDFSFRAFSESLGLDKLHRLGGSDPFYGKIFMVMVCGWELLEGWWLGSGGGGEGALRGLRLQIDGFG